MCYELGRMIIWNTCAPTRDLVQFEREVRGRMTQNRLSHDAYPYLYVRPYPEPDQLREWLLTQFPDPDLYMIWKGWILFKHQADALITSLTWDK